MGEEIFMVYVSCMTYNHSKYIEDAMEGFTKQQTDFPFVCCIVDDASVDGTQKLINRYLVNYFEIDDSKQFGEQETDDYIHVFARHKNNLNCHFAVFYLKYNHHKIKKSKLNYVSSLRGNSKYIAICEGDDYWIDSMKLQKQVDFMESHPQHSLCFCANKILLPSGETKDVIQYEEDKEVCPMEDIIRGGGDYMATNSMLYRNSMYVSHTTWTKNCPVGDIPIMLTLAQAGMVGYLADIMSVYRKSTEGSWSKRMASDKKKRRQHHYAILRMWDQFDKYSKHQYHDAIVKKKRNNNKAFWKGEITYVLSSIKRAIFGNNSFH